MIERVSQTNRIYNQVTELHTYTAKIDPKTLKTSYEHLICRIYDKHAQVKDYEFKPTVDKTA